MTKQLAKQDVNVQTIQQMVEQMGKRLSHAYEELVGKPEAQAAVLAVWQDVQQLGNVNAELNLVLQSVKASLAEAVEQRNIAVLDAKAWKRLHDFVEADVKNWEKHGVEMSQKRLAGLIAVACAMPLPDVERVLEILLQEKATFEDGALEEFLEAFANLGDSLYAEETYHAYSGDDKTEVFDDEAES